MFIDTHCHLSKEDYDIDKLIKDCNKNDVNTLIISGCDKKGIAEGLEIIGDYPNVYMTIGFHPSEIDTTTDEDINWLEELVKTNKKIVGIGEIGLDYHWESDKKEAQKELFEKQLCLAEKLHMPVVIHSRDATQDTYNILKEHRLKGIIHCYSGSLEMAKEYIKLGYYIGIGGVLTFKNTNLKSVVKELSLDNITLETDSPYLAPTPHRGEKNTPEYIPLIAEELAKIKEVGVSDVAEITTRNACQLFDLKRHI